MLFAFLIFLLICALAVDTGWIIGIAMAIIHWFLSINVFVAVILLIAIIAFFSFIGDWLKKKAKKK